MKERYADERSGGKGDKLRNYRIEKLLLQRKGDKPYPRDETHRETSCKYPRQSVHETSEVMIDVSSSGTF